MRDIAGGVLVGRIDSSSIVRCGHSRGAEGVAIAYHRLMAGAGYTPTHHTVSDIVLVDSMLPPDFNGPSWANPDGVNYYVWTAAATGMCRVGPIATVVRRSTCTTGRRGSGNRHQRLHSGGPEQQGRGVVFNWNGVNKYYEWAVAPELHDFTARRYLSLRGAWQIQYPYRIATDGMPNVTIALRDADNVTPSINTGAHGVDFGMP